MVRTIKRRHFGAFALLVAVALLCVLASSSEAAQEEEPNPLIPDQLPNSEVVPGQIIVKYGKRTTPAEKAALRHEEDLDKKVELSLIDAEVVKVEGRTTAAALRDLNRRSDVEYAEFDYVYQAFGYADEPRFGELWGLDQPSDRIGKADVDVNGKEASAITQGEPNLVVAVLDTGVDFTHPDLADRAWKNPGESGDGKETNDVDDDGNGYVDDVNGWDFCHNDNSVHDPSEGAHSSYGHGTHVAGTIAASVNGQGTVGVAPNVQIMALKFLGPSCGFTSDAVEALEYAKSKGVKISNNSWGGGGYSQALKDAIEASGPLFVAAAGNFSINNDTNPTYPASYDSPNILSVAGLNSYGNIPYSNYGPTSVDISAPGQEILSSLPAIPEMPAVALSSAGSSGGKAVTTGFGADEIGDSAKRASFFTKAFAAVDRGSEQVVLVVDDLSDTGSFPYVGATLSTAIQTATGSAPEMIHVTEFSDGPDLSQLSGKTVVWATGMATYSQRCFLCSDPITNLTTNDQQTLIDFLESGGKLVLTGQDALTGIQNSSFLTNTLKLKAQSDVAGKTAFNGSLGMAFSGESYTLNSSTARSSRHDVLTPADSAVEAQGTYPGVPQGWGHLSGTSMAAPHATGAAALVASQYPSLLSLPTGLKQVVMDSGKPIPQTAGMTVTGDMVDAEAALLGVSNVSPARNAKGVAGSINVTVSFNREMDPTTLTASTFTLTKQGSTTPVEATVSYDTQTKTATLDPKADLETDNTTYTATIKGGLNGVKDASGNPLPVDKVWTFSTADTTAPRVDTVSPANLTTGVGRSTDATATFTEKMAPASIITSTFKLFKCSSTTSTNCATQITKVAVSLSTDGLKATLNPYGTSSTLLAKTTKYKVEATTGVTDEAGNRLDQDPSAVGNQNKVWYFTTGRR